MDRSAIIERLEKAGLPFAPIVRPDDMFDDAHPVESGGLYDLDLPGGGSTRLPALLLEVDGACLPLRHPIPEIDEGATDIRAELKAKAAD